MKNSLILFILLIINVLSLKAQTLYTDYKPTYTEWDSRYILDKIDYAATRTIFHFRYLAKKVQSAMSFYGPLYQDKWCLENMYNPQEVYNLIELRNVKKNGYLLYAVFQGDELYFDTKPYDVYTCEIHFPKIPGHLKIVNFLEGQAKRAFSNNFHCLNVKVKPLNDSDLGSESDMITKIQKFEIRQFGWAKSTFPNTTIVKNKPILQPEKPQKPILKPESKEAQAQEGESE